MHLINTVLKNNKFERTHKKIICRNKILKDEIKKVGESLFSNFSKYK